MPALPPRSVILVTGTSGYIGCSIGLRLLEQGYFLRGAVKDVASARKIREVYESEGISVKILDSMLDFTIVEDLFSEKQWLPALKGVDGVAHVGLMLGDPNTPEAIDKGIQGTLSLMRAASRVGSIKRIVIKTSLATVMYPGVVPDKVLTAEDWNEDAIRAFDLGHFDVFPPDSKVRPFMIYAVAKAKAEQLAWRFMEETKASD